ELWMMHGHWSEGRRWLEAALALDRGVIPAARLRALLAAMDLARAQGDDRQAQCRAGGGLLLALGLGDKGATADAPVGLGGVAHHHNEYAGAHGLFAESLPLYREVGDRGGLQFALRMCGSTAVAIGDHVGAGAFYQEGLAVAGEMNNTHDIAASLM